MKTMYKKNLNKKNFYIKNVARFCDKCGTHYEMDNIQIVQEIGDSIVMHFFCSSCKSENFATFLSPMGLSTKIPINCDLSLKELKHFTKKEVISLDDVLEVYVHLEDSDGCIEI